MRVTTGSALFALLPALIHAVSLSDMTPRAENLPPACNKIYTSQISGCGIPDFTTKSCTDTCVKALQALVEPIKEACGGQGVTGQNLVVAFLANVGPQQICPDADLSGESSSAAPASTASPSPSPTSAQTTTSTASTTEASSSVQSTSLLVDTSSAASTRSRTQTPAFSGTRTASSLTESQSSTSTTSARSSSTSSSDAASATSTGSSNQDMTSQQTADSQSGGGSPFDNEGNMFSGADSLSSTSVLVSIGIAAVVVAFLFR